MPKQKKAKIYCGVADVPKGSKLGSMVECAKKNQVRYWGVKKIDPKILEREKIIDYLILGEGEESLPGLINALQDGCNLRSVNGLVFRNNGKIIVNHSKSPINK